MPVIDFHSVHGRERGAEMETPSCHRLLVPLHTTWPETKVKKALSDAALALCAYQQTRPEGEKFKVLPVIVLEDDSPDALEPLQAFYKRVIDCGWYGLVMYPELIGLIPVYGDCAEVLPTAEMQSFWHPVYMACIASSMDQGMVWVPSAEEHGPILDASVKAFRSCLNNTVGTFLGVRFSQSTGAISVGDSMIDVSTLARIVEPVNPGLPGNPGIPGNPGQ